MTKADWLAQLEACGGDLSQDSLINLVFKDGPNALWTDTVQEMHLVQDGMAAYLEGILPKITWNDWQGVTEVGQIYHSAYVPFDMSIFHRSMRICSPGDASECHTDYCPIPRGGITHLPPMEMYKAGFRTEPICIANIRSSKQALQIAKAIINERFSVDEQVMNAFYTMAVIRMLGHKWVLSYTLDANNNPIPSVNTNPRNMLQGFDYSYMNPLFPQPADLNKILPLDMRFLDMFGRALINSKNPNFVARGPRNEPIFELWHPEDWYRTEILDLPEYKELLKYTMMPNLLPGYSNDTRQEKEIIGNFSMKQMTQLPRFTESTQGGLTVVQPTTAVAVDGGNAPVHNFREWDNAPFIMVVGLGKGIGNIVARPNLTTGVEGQPIMPITGNEPWVYRNDYDKVCNEDLNMPHFRKRFELGLKLSNPEAGWGFIARAKNFRLRPVNICDMRPVFAIAPVSSDCSILEIGCNPGNDEVAMQHNNPIESDHTRYIQCQSKACGLNTLYQLEFSRGNVDSITPDQNPLACGCGAAVEVIIGGADNSDVSRVAGTLVEYLRPSVSHGPIWFVTIGSPLSTGQCIKGIVCGTESTTVATITECIDSTIDTSLSSTQAFLAVDKLIACNAGDNILVKWYDASNVLLHTSTGVISSVNEEEFIYHVTMGAAFTCDLAGYTTEVRMTLTCA